MQIGRTMGVFLSGCAVYVVMAACSSQVGINNTGGHASTTSGHGGHGGGTTAGTGGHGGGSGGHGGAASDSGILDVLTDPVPSADASPMSGSRLKKRYLLGDDGTREDLPGWYDTQRQEECAFAPAADGKIRCLPTTAATTEVNGTYVDSACTMALQAGYPPDCNATPKYGRLAVASTCPPAYRFYPVTQVVSMSGVVSLFGKDASGNCVYLNAAAQGGATGLKLDAEIDPTSFVAAMPMVDP